MEVLIVNASPRAPISHSKEYGRLLGECLCKTENVCVQHTIALREKQVEESVVRTQTADHVVLVFPLYVDSVPVTVLSLFSKLAQIYAEKQAPFVMHVVINCGFLESYQNNTAVSIVRLFCKRQGISFGSVLRIGSGEAILGTPFQKRVEAALNKLAQSIISGEAQTYSVQMPLPKWLFIRASNRFWLKRGQKNGLTRAQMEAEEVKDARQAKNPKNTTR